MEIRPGNAAIDGLGEDNDALVERQVQVFPVNVRIAYLIQTSGVEMNSSKSPVQGDRRVGSGRVRSLDILVGLWRDAGPGQLPGCKGNAP
jgi:hypothetical protein